jgi:hypothetical protein
MLNGERMAKHVPTVFNSTDIVTLAQVSPPAEGAGREKARVLSKQQQGTSRVKARVLSQHAKNVSIWVPEISLRLVSLPSNQESSSSTFSIAEDAQPNPTQTRWGERRAMAKKAGVGARYVLVFQDGSRHPFNMVPGRKFTIGQIM